MQRNDVLKTKYSGSDFVSSPASGHLEPCFERKTSLHNNADLKSVSGVNGNSAKLKFGSLSSSALVNLGGIGNSTEPVACSSNYPLENKQRVLQSLGHYLKRRGYVSDERFNNCKPHEIASAALCESLKFDKAVSSSATMVEGESLQRATASPAVPCIADGASSHNVLCTAAPCDCLHFPSLVISLFQSYIDLIKKMQLLSAVKPFKKELLTTVPLVGAWLISDLLNNGYTTEALEFVQRHRVSLNQDLDDLHEKFIGKGLHVESPYSKVRALLDSLTSNSSKKIASVKSGSWTFDRVSISSVLWNQLSEHLRKVPNSNRLMRAVNKSILVKAPRLRSVCLNSSLQSAAAAHADTFGSSKEISTATKTSMGPKEQQLLSLGTTGENRLVSAKSHGEDDEHGDVQPSPSLLRDQTFSISVEQTLAELGHKTPSGPSWPELDEALAALDSFPAPLPTLKYFRIKNEQTTTVCCGTFSGNRRHLATGFDDSTIRVWTLAPHAHSSNLWSYEEPNVSDMDTHNSAAAVSRYRSSSHLVLEGAGDVSLTHTLRSRQTDDGSTSMMQHMSSFSEPRSLVLLGGHCGSVYALKFLRSSPLVNDFDHLLSTGHDGKARLFSLAMRQCVCAYNVSPSSMPVWDVDIFGADSGSCDHFATASFDRTVRLFAFDRLSALRVFAGHSNSVDCVRYHPNGRFLASASADGSTLLWSINEARAVRMFSQRLALSDEAKNASAYALAAGVPSAMAFSYNGRLLAVAYGDTRYVIIWDIATQLPFMVLSDQLSSISSVCFCQDDSLIATGSREGAVSLWNIQNASPMLTAASSPIKQNSSLHTFSPRALNESTAIVEVAFADCNKLLAVGANTN